MLPSGGAKPGSCRLKVHQDRSRLVERLTVIDQHRDQTVWVELEVSPTCARRPRGSPCAGCKGSCGSLQQQVGAKLALLGSSAVQAWAMSKAGVGVAVARRSSRPGWSAQSRAACRRQCRDPRGRYRRSQLGPRVRPEVLSQGARGAAWIDAQPMAPTCEAWPLRAFSSEGSSRQGRA